MTERKLKPIPRCPSVMLLCGCRGICSQTVFLHTDAEMIALGYEPPLLLTPEMEYQPDGR